MTHLTALEQRQAQLAAVFLRLFVWSAGALSTMLSCALLDMFLRYAAVPALITEGVIFIFTVACMATAVFAVGTAICGVAWLVTVRAVWVERRRHRR